MSIQPRPDSYTIFFSSAINLTHTQTFASNGGSVTWDNCVLNLTTGSSIGSVAQIEGYLPCYLNQEEEVSVTLNAAFTWPYDGTRQMLGMGDAEEGVFLGFENTQFCMMTTKGGSRRYWSLSITNGCTSSGAMSLTLLDQVFSINVPAGASAIQVMYIILQTQALNDANLHVIASPNSLTIYTDYCADFAPTAADSFNAGSTGVVASLQLVNPGNDPVRSWIYISDFSERGRELPATLDLTQFQVYRFLFSRWSNARIILEMLDPTTNTYIPLHCYVPGPAGFNTSKPYMPHVFIRNNTPTSSSTVTVPVTLKTSMANITSGTPATNTNATYFSTDFNATQISIDSTNQYVIGAMHVPVILNGRRNHTTSSVTEINIVVNSPQTVQLRIIASGGISSPLSTSATVPWSTLLHGTPSTPTYVSSGLTVVTINVQPNVVSEVEPKQLWLAPGTTVYFALTLLTGAPVTMDVSALVTWSES